MSIALSASVSCIDPLEYRRDTLRLDAAGVDALHFDLCDGHFAPTFLLSPGLLHALRPLTERRFDAHLYCTHPSRYLHELRQAGTDVVVVQVEADEDAAEVVPRIRAAGMKAGIALLPTTPAPSRLAALLPALLESGCTHLVCGTSSIFRPHENVGEALIRFRRAVCEAERAQMAL